MLGLPCRQLRILNGYVEYEGMQATIYCIFGISVQGSSVLLCNGNTNQWNGEAPTCAKGKLVLIMFLNP